MTHHLPTEMIYCYGSAVPELNSHPYPAILQQALTVGAKQEGTGRGMNR